MGNEGQKPSFAAALLRLHAAMAQVARGDTSAIKARRLAHDHAERERAAAAVKTWLLAQIEKKRPAVAMHIEETAPHEPFAPERLAA